MRSPGEVFTPLFARLGQRVKNVELFLHIFLTMGVDRVWIVDLNSRRLHVFRSDAEPCALRQAEILTDESTLPSFSCIVRRFFED